MTQQKQRQVPSHGHFKQQNPSTKPARSRVPHIELKQGVKQVRFMSFCTCSEQYVGTVVADAAVVFH